MASTSAAASSAAAAPTAPTALATATAATTAAAAAAASPAAAGSLVGRVIARSIWWRPIVIRHRLARLWRAHSWRLARPIGLAIGGTTALLGRQIILAKEGKDRLHDLGPRVTPIRCEATRTTRALDLMTCLRE